MQDSEFTVKRAKTPGVLAAVLGLAACSGGGGHYVALTEAELAAIDVRGELRACCSDVGGSFSEEFVLATEKNSFWVAPFSRAVKTRPSWLEDDVVVHEAILEFAKPLDLIMIGNASRLSGATGEGLFGHVAVYLGTEAELRALGIWDDPAVVPFHADIRKGKITAEALDTDVHLSGAPELFETDHVAVFRPRGYGPARKRDAILAVFRDLGRPFDFHFDNDDPTQIYCTELVDRALPDLNMPAREMYGRNVILPDEVVAAALAGDIPLDPLFAIRGYPQGWKVMDNAEMTALLLGSYPR